MRRCFPLLFVLVVFSISLHAQKLKWTKNTYNYAGYKVERADFTGGGYADVLIYGGNTVTVLPNAKTSATSVRQFDTANAFTLNMSLTDVAILDFNRDGMLDVAACRNDGSPSFVILQGTGGGHLSQSQTFPVACNWVATSDFNGDGNPDVAVGLSANGDNQVIVYLGDGHGGILGQVVNDHVDFISSEGNPCTLNGHAVAADFTGDKVADLAITADCPNDVDSFGALIVGKGDGTGHFAFHKDIETNFDAGMRLRLADGNGDGNPDIAATASGSGPHSSSWSSLVLFISHGDGTFESKEITSVSSYAGIGDFMPAAVFMDLDSDGIKDGLAMIDTFDDVGTESYSLKFFKGQPDGTYALADTAVLSHPMYDMVWGDFDKDGRADLAIARIDSTDVWFNDTSPTINCVPFGGVRSIAACVDGSPSLNFHFLGNPLDDHIVNAIQVYVDGVRKFQTPDDLLDTNLKLTDGTHRITLKAWDDLGAFNTTQTMQVCGNTANRTVRICSPQNGSVAGSPWHLLANAFTTQKFYQLLVYFDGVVRIRDDNGYLDVIANPPTTKGTHRLTFKGWDTQGAFSSSITYIVP